MHSRSSAVSWTALLQFSLLITLALFLSACGGGSGGGSLATPVTALAPDEEGVLVIGLTDAEGDFVSYEVDVLALSLERLDGTQVEALPLNTRVDFAELTEVTELLTVATVPRGNYRSVALTLDYSDARILVQDSDGAAIPAEALGEDGQLLDQISVRLRLTTSDLIRIAPGVPAAFSLDFDLDASNDIDLTSSPVAVTVQPFLLATPELETDREHRVRGVLASADTADETITLKVRPFRHRAGQFGEFTLSVTDETRYEVDGEPLMGADGLMAVADLAENTPLIAHGMVIAGDFVADAVLAGSSVPWTQADVVKGVITAREDRLLTVRGVRIEYADGTQVIRDTVTVEVGDDTAVTALGVPPGSLTQQSLSVGQRVVAFGELNESMSQPESDEVEYSLDATAGRVRMVISTALGRVMETDPLVLDLHLLSGRRPAIYDFSGTGSSPVDDADPDFYQVATRTLPLLNLSVNNMIRVRGLVNEFGAAPDDFLARTVISKETDLRPALFIAGWPDPGAMPIASLDDRSVALDLSDARYALRVLGRKIAGNDAEDGADSETSALDTLTLLATESGRGVYAVRVRGAGEIHVYRSFSELSAELVQQLDAGRELRRATAHGRYNSQSGVEELETVRASFDFVEPVVE